MMSIFLLVFSPLPHFTIFGHVKSRAIVMRYWERQKRASYQQKLNDLSTEHTKIILQSPKYDKVDIPVSRRGPDRKLTLEQEFLMTMMRLRLHLLVDDLAFRFKTSNTKVSQIWITWIKLISKELQYLIIWPSKGQICATLPECSLKCF